MRTSSHLHLATLAVVLLAPFQSHGQLSDARLFSPAKVKTNERADAVAVGWGRVALGSRNALNSANGQTSGAVYLFDQKTGAELKTLYPPATDSNSGMEFGSSIAIAGNLLLIGAPGADSLPASSDDRGAAYVFDLKTGKFVGTKIQPPTEFAPGERWGHAVAVDGEFMAVSSILAVEGGIATGAVWVKSAKATTASMIAPNATLLDGATPGAAQDKFGSALSLRGNLLAVSAPGTDISGDSDAGRVWLVSLTPGGVGGTVVMELPNPDVVDASKSGVGDLFGESLALGSRFLIIGAPADSTGAAATGGAFVYQSTALHAIVYYGVARGGSAGERVGQAVATEGNRIFFSSPGRYVSSQVVDGPLTSNTFFTPRLELPGQYGHRIAIGEDRLVVADPEDSSFDLNGGGVWLHDSAPQSVPDFHPVATSGNTALGIPNSTYSVFTEVTAGLYNTAFNLGANPLFVAKAAGSGVVGSLNTGLRSHSGVDNVTRLVITAQTNFTTISRPISSFQGEVWFTAKQPNYTLPNIVVQAGNTFAEQLFAGSDLLLGVNYPVKSVGELRVDSTVTKNGAIPVNLKLGANVVTTNDSAVLRLGSNSMNTFVARESETVFGIASFFWGQIAPRVSVRNQLFSCSGAVFGNGTTTDTNQAVICGSVVAARKGDSAPDTVNTSGVPVATTFSTFLGETHFDAGSGLFRATLNPVPGITPANNEGIWSNRTGGVGLIVQKGATAPVIGGQVKVKRLIDYGIVFGKRVLILAQVSGPGITAANDVVLYLCDLTTSDPGPFEILAREGDYLPGGGRARIASILTLDLTTTPTDGGHSHYGLLCSLVVESGGATAATNQAWLVGDAGRGLGFQPAIRQPTIRLRKGQTSNFLGSGFEKLSSIAFPAVIKDGSGVLNSGMAHVIDPRSGGSTGVVTFPNRKKTVGSIR